MLKSIKYRLEKLLGSDSPQQSRRDIHEDVPSKKEALLAQYPSGSPEHNLLGKVDYSISKKDDMYANDAAHYFKVGLSAIECIDNALSKVDERRIKKVLDMPCGFGRVLRFLIHRFPGADFTGVDLEESGVDFCAETLGVKGVYSKKNLEELSLDGSFDLIWCGSLITHLGPEDTRKLLKFFDRHLSPNGLLLYTIHGTYPAQQLENGSFSYGLEAEVIPGLIKSYNEDGYGYVDYKGQENYGISLTSVDWFREQFKGLPGWREIFFIERGWDNHQDVLAIIKS